MKSFREYYKEIIEEAITPEEFIENFLNYKDACLKVHEGFNNFKRVNKNMPKVEKFNPLSVINLKLNPWAKEENLNQSLKLFLIFQGYEYENIERKAIRHNLY
jgi:hypothetical protein